jgi:anti-anti-sigma factor
MGVLMDDSRLIVEFDEASPDVAVCRLDGEFDLAEADRVRDLLIAELERRRLVAVDLQDLRFIDSNGFRALHEAQCAAAEQSARLVFVSAQDPVTRVVRMIGFDHLEFTDDRSVLDGHADNGGAVDARR